MENSCVIILFLAMVMLAGTALWLILLIKTPYLEAQNRQNFSFMLLVTCFLGIAGIGLLTTVM